MKRRDKCMGKCGQSRCRPAENGEGLNPPAKEDPADKEFNLYRGLEQVLTAGLVNLRSEAVAYRPSTPRPLTPELDYLTITARLAILEYFINEIVQVVEQHGPTISTRPIDRSPLPGITAEVLGVSLIKVNHQ